MFGWFVASIVFFYAYLVFKRFFVWLLVRWLVCTMYVRLFRPFARSFVCKFVRFGFFFFWGGGVVCLFVCLFACLLGCLFEFPKERGSKGRRMETDL